MGKRKFMIGQLDCSHFCVLMMMMIKTNNNDNNNGSTVEEDDDNNDTELKTIIIMIMIKFLTHLQNFKAFQRGVV